MKYFIFDFDGVLCDSLEPCVKIIAESLIFGTSDLKEIKRQFLNYFGQPSISKEKNPQQKEKDWYFLKNLSDQLVEAKPDLFEEFIQQLEDVHNTKDYKLAIVSSGFDYYIKAILGSKSLMFDFIYGFETSSSKQDKVKLVCKSWEVKPDDCYYFTDTVGDVLELQGLFGANKIVGCEWGFHGLSRLNKHLPKERILEKQTDLWNFCLQINLE
jgi:phosphoserine phosphatase